MEYGAAQRGRAVDRPGKVGRVRPRHARRDRHRHACRRTSAHASARRRSVRARRSSACRASSSSAIPTGVVEYGLPLRHDITRRDPRAPARGRDHAQPPRHVGWPLAEHGRPSQHRRGGARRGARRGQPWVFTDAGERVEGRAHGVRERFAGTDACGRRDRHARCSGSHRCASTARTWNTSAATPTSSRDGPRRAGAQLGTKYATSFEVYEF